MWLVVNRGILSLLAADGPLNATELDWFRRFHAAAGTHEDFVGLLVSLYAGRSRQHDQSPSKWELLLEVPKGADQETIKKAYRRKVSEYHPDKLASVSEGLKRLAEEKVKEINDAYERLTAPGHVTEDVPDLLVFDGQDWKSLKSVQVGVVLCCPMCAQKNRLPDKESGAIARCGACHAYLGLYENQLQFLSFVTKPVN